MQEIRLYTIGEVAKRLGVSTTTLKLWEKSGYIPKARRVKLNKTRVYSQSQIEAIVNFMRAN